MSPHATKASPPTRKQVAVSRDAERALRSEAELLGV
jgi:hypothetical protein